MGIFNNLNDPQNAGILALASQLLQASGPSNRPVGFGEALGSGILSMQQAQAQARDRQQMDQLRGLQIQSMQGEMSDKEMARKRAADIQKAMTEFNTPTGNASSVLGNNLAPTMANAQLLSAAPQANDPYSRHMALANYLRQKGFGQEADAQEVAATKFAPEFDQTPRTATRPDGSVFQYVLDKRGNMKVLDGVLPRDEMKLADTGGGLTAYNPFALQAGQQFRKSMSPDAVASNAVARARLGFDMSQAQQPQFNYEAGGFVVKPNAQNPSGAVIPVPGMQGKPMTEAQGKSALFSSRADAADKIIGDLTGKYSPMLVNSKMGAENMPLIGGLAGAASNASPFYGAAEQRAEQAQRDFLNAVLRQESGAVIGPTEFENAKKQYFPQPGDDASTIAQKAANRRLAVEGIARMAGPRSGAQPAAPGGIKFLGFEGQ